MQTKKLTTQSLSLLVLLFLAASVQATPTQLASSPLSGASSVAVSPNVLFVLDDSGSMNLDYLPDWAGRTVELSMRRNASFNGVTYNPGVTYTPPKYFDAAGNLDTTTYPAQTSPWTTVKDDGFVSSGSTSSNLTTRAFYFTTEAGEYCTNQSMKTCVAASAPSVTYPVAAKLRWCKTAADAIAATPTTGACQATQIEPSPPPPATATNVSFNYPRMPSPRTSTFTISGTISGTISSITVGGQNILPASVVASGTAATLASDLETGINGCSFGITGSCQVAGYSAVASGNTLTINAPIVTTATPMITQGGSISFAPTAFARPSSNLAPGENLRTVITSTTTTYPKAITRSDCAEAATCTYAEEMTNYANWWAYYRTRMQTMKTAASLSFENINGSFRVGYMSINNNNPDGDFLNLDAFTAAQKKAWYDKLFAAVPNQDTPLRVALSNAGRLYAGKLSSLYDITVVDPVQHYCQKNVTLLSTDGYWNQGAGFQVDGSTAVGDQDGPGLEARPQLDAGSPQDQVSTEQTTQTQTFASYQQAQYQTAQTQSSTSQLQTRTLTQAQEKVSQLQSKDAQLQSSTSQLQQSTFTQLQISTLTQVQQQTSQLRRRTGPLQLSTSNLQTRTQTPQERTSQLQSMTAQMQSRTYQLQQNLTPVQQRTSSDFGTTWSGWTNVASCSTTEPRFANLANLVQCRTQPQTGWTNVSSCTVATGSTVVSNPGTDREVYTYTADSQCQYTSASAWGNVGSCTAVEKSTGPTNYTVGVANDCQTTWPNPWVNAASCTVSATQQCQYTAWTGYSNVGSCTAQAQSSAPNYTVGVARQCQTGWTSWADTASTCTPSATVGCQYSAWTSYANDSTCTPLAKSAASPYTVTTARQCQVKYGSWSNVASCTEVASGATQTQCQYLAYSAWSNVGSCTPAAQSTGPSYTGPARNCQTIWTTPVNTATCTPSATTNCTTTWTAPVNVPSCTAVSGSVNCSYTNWTGWTNVASCSELPQSTGPNYTVGVATQCQTTWPNPWVIAASCTVSATRQCQYTAWPGSWTDVASCSAQAQSGASPYTVGVARQCQTTWTGWSNAASCTASGTVGCQYTAWSGYGNAASCTPLAQSSAPNYSVGVATQCQTVPVDGSWTNTATPSTPCVPGTSGTGLVTTCNPDPPTVTPPATNEFVQAGTCQAGTVGAVTTTCNTATLSGPTNVPYCAPSTGSAPNWIATVCAPGPSTGPTSDTLADVAEYYWKTDLRDPSLENCTGGPVVTGESTFYNNVCTNDTQYPRQSMNTYTLGLGASGLMQFQANYLTATSGDYYSVWQGLTANPLTGDCPWQGSSACNWPLPENNSQTNIDDLWHAAVNGRGTYFSATDPSSLAAGISGALSAVTVRSGALSSVSVTSVNLAAGSGNSVFEVSFTVGEWSGDVVKRTINGTTGVLSTTAEWSAQARLDALYPAATSNYTSRKVYTFNLGGSSSESLNDNLKFFTWANLNATERGYFALSAIAPPTGSLSQFCATGSGTICLSATTQTAASGEPLVDFLRGDRSNEGPLSNLGAYYRQRNHLLGDIVGSEAVYVQGSPWNYADYNYAGFKTSNSSRAGMVYVAANDGMLHAFDETTGDEAWAYVPAFVLPTVYKLADKSYASLHQFFVDGTPVMGDICASDCATPAAGDTAHPVWKTILVGGLNHGGRGYYALDITTPAAPKALWEFTHDNLGYSYGNPVITKLKNGTWVVIVASGYNNIGPGDGKGYLFILNADSGALIRAITTDVGDTTTPSGLARITAWANFPDNNNTAQQVYGGDLLGNLWRFDINGDIPTTVDPPVYDAQRLATLKDASGVAQPITSKPELGKVGSNSVVYVGTGQLLGANDLSSNQQQSLYAIKDRLALDNPDYGSPRPLSPAQTTPTPGSFVQQTLTAATCGSGNSYCTAGTAIISSSGNAVDFNIVDGWFMDYPVAGERVNTDLRLVLGTLTFNTNTPTLGACVPVGSSNAYFVDYKSGGYVEGTNGLSGVHLGSFLATAPSMVRLSDGTIRALIRTDAPGTISQPVPTAPNPLDTRRISWRELVAE